MIRVNLLEGTAEQRVSAQKTKVAARRGQQLLMLGAALSIFAIAIAIDYVYTDRTHAEAKHELEQEQAEAAKLEADIARKNELEAELKQVEERIKIIKQLRAEQKGPVAMLTAINERMPGANVDFELQSITQKGNHLQIIGNAINQQTVADFAHRLEFSTGMFTSLMFSVEGKEIKVPDGTDKADKPDKADKKTDKPDKKTDKPEAEDVGHLFHFTIDCDYNKPRDPGSDEAKPATPGK
jgi:Tfp pilus assembly protein PilN